MALYVNRFIQLHPIHKSEAFYFSTIHHIHNMHSFISNSSHLNISRFTRFLARNHEVIEEEEVKQSK
ncbi:hypothetical protein PIB30_089272, partial [Stylosanthes scabra]|nr:hypothetical protein [Stylosanthes scabra]